VVKPVLQALLIADHVYVDKVTGKKVVAGIFHRMHFTPAKPIQEQNSEEGRIRLHIPPGGLQAGSPFCYISLTEVRNQQHFALRYVDLADDRMYFQSEFDVDCRNPLETIEIVLPLPPLPANKAGVFALELLWNDEHLGSHRINVDEVKQRNE
jgi:hypothetical protein